MSKTLYEIFRVSENATSEEIENSYNKMLKKAETLPQSDELVEKLRKVKVAYDILMTPEKRKQYDIDLSNKRAEELLQNVKSNSELQPEQEKDDEIQENISSSNESLNVKPKFDEQKIREEIRKQIDIAVENGTISNLNINNENSSQQEKIVLDEKTRKKLEKEQKKIDKKNMQYEKEKQINAYGRYLESKGYKVKYPWTWLRIKRLLITLISIILSIFVLWQIPFIRNSLINLYKENMVVNILVNIVISIFDRIKGIFK